MGDGSARQADLAAQGLAVTVMKAGTFPAKLRALSRRDGLPPLPAADICLHRSAKLSRAGALLADHLRATIVKETPRPPAHRYPGSTGAMFDRSGGRAT